MLANGATSLWEVWQNDVVTYRSVTKQHCLMRRMCLWIAVKVESFPL
jgi:hypothetical protein